MTFSFSRKDQANLLGFDDYAAMSMETKMAGSLENVKKLLASLLTRGTVLLESFISLYSPIIDQIQGVLETIKHKLYKFSAVFSIPC